MIDYISRQMAIDDVLNLKCESKVSWKDAVIDTLEDLPSADVVPRSILEQVKWERGVAMKQLEDLGIGFGEKVKDVVEVVRCKDCEYGIVPDQDGNLKSRFCYNRNGLDAPVRDNDYCSYGEMRADESN